MSDRAFTKAEIKKAEMLLLVLAHESSRYWANAFLSPSFLYQGEVIYYDSVFYKSGRWIDVPNNNHDPITGDQIMKFINVYMDEAKKEIKGILCNDMEIAKILGKESRLNNVNWLGNSDADYYFGAWNNDPWGAVAIAKKAAGLEGEMSINSGYRETRVVLCRGKIYIWHFGNSLIAEIDIQD